jgi:hypothetical protein
MKVLFELMRENFGTVISLLMMAVGLGAGVAYALFKRFGERWLDTRFDARMADYKHKHQIELETLKYRITGHFDRLTKLNQREFEILPEAWSKLSEALIYCRSAVARIQSIPNFSDMSEDKFELFLTTTMMTELQKVDFRQVPKKDRIRYYSRHLSWQQLADADKKFREYQIFVKKNCIFIDRDFLEKFDRFTDLLNGVLIECEFSLEGHQGVEYKERKILLSGEADRLLKELEAAIYTSLWSSREAQLE